MVCQDMKKIGLEISKKALRQEIQKRDERDANRAHSPLKKAEDSIVLDTTHLSIDQQVDFILNKINEVK